MFDICQTDYSIHYNNLIWCFWTLFHFRHSNVAENKCRKQNWCMLFFTCIKLVVCICDCTHQMEARLKTMEILEFFLEIFKSQFSILAVGQNQKVRNKKTQNNISEVSEFSICHLFIFPKNFFQYSEVGNFVLCIYVMYCFRSLLKCFFLQQKYIMFKILPCRDKIYFLWDISTKMCMRCVWFVWDVLLKPLSFLKKLLRGYLHYKMITSQNVSYKAQVKNFFIL